MINITIVNASVIDGTVPIIDDLEPMSKPYFDPSRRNTKSLVIKFVFPKERDTSRDESISTSMYCKVRVH